MNGMGMKTAGGAVVTGGASRTRLLIVGLALTLAVLLALPAVSLAGPNASPSSVTFTDAGIDGTGTDETFATVTVTRGCGLLGTGDCSGAQAFIDSGTGQFRISDRSSGCPPTSGTLGSTACVLTVGFKPTALGTFNGVLKFTTTATFGNTAASVPLTGTGIAAIRNFQIRDNSGSSEMSTYSFGDTGIGDTKSYVFTVRNTGNSIIHNVTSTLSGTTAPYTKSTTCGTNLAASSSCTVTVTYVPTSVGSHPVTLTVGTTDAGSRTTAISAAGEPAAPVAAVYNSSGTEAQTSQDFGSIATGYSSVPYTFTLRNLGNVPILNPTAQAFSGANPTLFTRTTTCGSSLAVGAKCEITVTFSPTANGSFSSTLRISPTNVPAMDLSLTGVGATPAAGLALQNSSGTATQSSHDFGSVAVGNTSGSYSFTLRNTGNVPITNASTQALGGTGAAQFARSTTCGTTLLVGGRCSITLNFTPAAVASYTATLTVTPGNFAAQTATLTGSGAVAAGGLRILNNTAIGTTGQKAWLDSQAVAINGSDGDRARFSFDVASNTADMKVNDVLISTTSTTTDTAPADDTFTNVPEDGLGTVRIYTASGSGKRQFVTAEMSMNTLQTAGWASGLVAGTVKTALTGDAVPTCNSFVGSTSNRRIWLRLRDSDGRLSEKVGSIIRVTSGTQCDFTAAWDSAGINSTTCALVTLGSCSGTANGPAYLYDQRITSVAGSAPPAGTTQNATVRPNDAVTVTFKPRGAVANANAVSGVNWRIRNTTTNAIYTRNGAAWASCAAPCTTGYSTAAGSQIAFTAPLTNGLDRAISFTAPARGRWIVEAAINQPSSGDTTMFHYIASINVNSAGTVGPTVSLSGTPSARPNTDSVYNLHATVNDPGDTGSNGAVQIVDWDLDNNPTNGPLGDGYEVRVVADPDTGLAPAALDRVLDLAGKTPGPYTVRVRVTDNGAVNSGDPTREQQTATSSFTINSKPVPDAQDVYVEADDAQPQSVTLSATDHDGDPITYTVPALQATVGDLVAGGVDGSAASYTWPTTFTGIDPFTFVAADDHAGSATATVRVHVRPNTTIDDVATTGTPLTNATQTTSQSFEFSSPQTPVTAFECRLDRNGEEVDDWDECAATSVGSKSYTDLPDGSYTFSVRAINADGERDGTPATYDWRVDTTAPITEYVAGSRADESTNRQPDGSPLSPVGPTKDQTPQFKLSIDDASPQETATYECRIDYGPRADQWKPCGDPADATGSSIIDLIDEESPWWLNAPLPEGTYTFEARAVDEVGLHGPGTTRTFTVDLTAPSTTIDNGPEGLLNTRTVEFAVSSSEEDSVIDCRLVLHRESAPDEVVYPTTPSDPWYSTAGFRPCPGGAAPSFSGLADGKYTLSFVAVDAAGNSDPTPKSVDFEVDATGPSTFIDSTVPVAQQARTITFAFHGTDARDDDTWYGPGSVNRFECRFDSSDDDEWTPCQSPETYGGLADGTHTFEVRAIDQAGNIDGNPATASFRVDNTPPETTVTASPDAFSNVAEPAIEFEANEDVDGFECKLYAPGVDPDTVDWAACASPYEPTVDEDGPWSFEVRATDVAGNVETTPATASWTQDTVKPTVVIDSHPADPSVQSDARFAFSADDETSASVATECKLDDGDWDACTSPISYDDLTDGPHSFAVKAIDQAGNESDEATYDWGVYVNDPPEPEIQDATPTDAGRWSIRTFQAAYSAHAASVTLAYPTTVQCSLDGAAWAACPQDPNRPNRFTATGMTDGDHSFRLRAKDPAGNLSPVVERTWTVDTTAPRTSIDSAPSGLVSSRTAEFKLSSNESDATFQCRLDSGDWQPCNEIQPAGASSAAEFVLTDLAQGWHTIAVRALDVAKPTPNVDASPVTRKWKVDTVVPTARITSGPEDLSPVKDATFAFESDDPEATFQCKIGVAAWAPCTSPIKYTDLDEGDQTFLVAAIDPAGNTQAEPAEHRWIIAVPGKKDDDTPVDGNPEPGSNAVSGKLVRGTIKLGTLPELVLEANQLTVSGTWDQVSGALALPKDKIRFATISVDAGSVVPGATAKIILSATGDGSGTLPAAGGAGAIKVPVTAKVEVYAASGAPLLNLGASSNCTIGPIDFDLSGQYNGGTKAGTFANGAVSVPGAGAGCGAIGGTLGSAIGIPSSTNAVSLDLVFSAGSGEDVKPDDQKKPDPVAKEGAIKLSTTSAKLSTKYVAALTVACTSTQTIDSCSAGKLSLKAKVKTKKKKGKKTVTVTKTVTVGTASYAKLAAGKTAAVKVTLNKTGKTLAKAGKKAKVSTVLQSSAKGAKAVNGSLSLTYPKPKKSTTKTKKRALAPVAVPAQPVTAADQGEQE
jgi:hypothetical protein